MEYSLLDVALVGAEENPAAALHGAVPLAQAAERGGYRRVWYAEHHNMPQIASAATSVLIAHVAAHTERIRLGAGGVMLPNHAPLVIAEQFGTLAALHPGRIDLGLGRAPGTDQNTLRALRRTAQAADDFPQDVLELQGYLTGRSRVPGVRATPGDGSNVPLYILGSSLFGARLAAALGLPYAFASHFAPAALDAAAATYRAEFQPTAQQPEPHLIVAANLIAAESEQEADAQLQAALRWRARRFLAPDARLTDAELDALLDAPAGRQIRSMTSCTAAGTPLQAHAYLARLAARTAADELILSPAAPRRADRLRAVELVTAPAPPSGTTPATTPGTRVSTSAVL
ncbi:LLM class flavin-dependent oxidoreductase [Actinocrinis puniceicyclus]|uniref:LLM class flavin-dependent oxidoreductase n=1 Tax=Actinocrinis puniceicyclus TaxID=977794 RepID=A0A8J7WG17_9ACTN|nr:LLM class flavin-dependent oxidoreductase [Actinocrinis puniceicyclus]MBS2961531.1 LLM class flavin-dependent oxidoreductase [Actinocrinis puniceicyclus]